MWGIRSSISGDLGRFHLLRIMLLCTWVCKYLFEAMLSLLGVPAQKWNCQNYLSLLSTNAAPRGLFTSPGTSGIRSSDVTARGSAFVMNRWAEGLECTLLCLSGRDPPSLSLPPSHLQSGFPARRQQGCALGLRVPGAQAEAVQRGAREALRCRQAIPAPGRW